MDNEKDSTPLTEDINEVAAAEGVAPADSDTPPKRGRPKGSKNKNTRDRSEEYKRRYEKQKAAGKKTETPKPSQSAPDVEPPFTAAEIREAMNTMGGALFALPAEGLAQRRPDLADKLQMGPEETAFGGKAINYYVQSRFPDMFEKWGPEAMLFGAILVFYGPRLLLIAKTPKPPPAEASIDGKPAPIRAVPNT